MHRRGYRVALLERARGTGGDAADAGAAVIRWQRPRVDLEIGHELAQKEVRAGLAMQHERVLPDPPDPGATTPLALEDGTRVDVREITRAGEELRQRVRQLIESRLDVPM